MTNRGHSSTALHENFNQELISGGMPRTLKDSSNQEGDNRWTLAAKKNV